MISCQIEILSQAQLFLKSISDLEYKYIAKPNFTSSAGSHIRHIIDHYLAIQDGIECGLIDYDNRHRGHEIEQQPSKALKYLNSITKWLNTLSENDLKQTVELSTEISISNQERIKLPTNIARELVFAASHAIHHYAILAQIARAQALPLPANFGIAPATATFLRQQQLEK